MKEETTMKKKYIILLITALVGGILGATAQDVTILHMKDGTQRRYVNGLKERTNMQFYEFAPAEQDMGHYTTNHNNGYSYDWGVTNVWNYDGEYSVALVWKDDVPKSFNVRRGLCFGTTPGLTIDHCDSLEYCTDDYYTDYYGEYTRIRDLNISYILISPRTTLQEFRYQMDGRTIRLPRYYHIEDNIINATLEHGKTYYYRTFAEGQAEENGQVKPVVFYGPEKSFRVPHVMTDSDYNTYPQFSDEALAIFSSAHFPANTTVPSRKQLEPLWNEWRQTEEGAAFDITAYTSSQTFDDGIGYRLNFIPESFYTWLTQREIVIDAWNGLSEVSKIRDEESTNYADSIETVKPTLVDNVNTSWGIPNNRWVRFEQNITNTNHFVLYRNEEMVPGLRYKLQITFAPETKDDATDTEKLPCILRVTTTGSNDGSLYMPHEASGSQVTILAEDFTANAMDNCIKIETRVSNSDIRGSKAIRVLRISELRLIPY